MENSSTTQPPLRYAMPFYGLLGLPLAMAALPIYLQAPQYYSESLGASLSLIGSVLFLARVIDTLQEPFLGQWIDRLAKRQKLSITLWLAVALLSLAFAGIWLPPAPWGSVGLALWLGLMLALAYSAHSVLQIAYLAWGARLGEQVMQQKAAAWREGFGLIGVVLASTLGIWLLGHSQTAWALPLYCLLFAALLVLGLAALLRAAPVWSNQSSAHVLGFHAAWKTPAFKQILLPFFLNALSVALPATLVLFFITDRLQAGPWAGVYLMLYFLAGAASLGWWNRLSQRIGIVSAWRIGMLMAIAGFAIAAWLGPQTAWIFGIVCLFTGWTVGADLVLPAVLLASRIPAHAQPASFYGVSSLLGKLALASSALALPLLAQLGYEPGVIESSTVWLACLYAGLPCIFKLMAWFFLQNASISRRVV